MKSNRHDSARRAFVTLAFSFFALQSAVAQTVDNAAGQVVGNLPTCKTMLTNCLNFSQRAQEAAGPGGTIDANITPGACYDMYHLANASGTWPANLPLGFAMDCTTDHERHHRHHVFRNMGGTANATPIADPAQTPATPPVAITPTAN